MKWKIAEKLLKPRRRKTFSRLSSRASKFSTSSPRRRQQQRKKAIKSDKNRAAKLFRLTIRAQTKKDLADRFFPMLIGEALCRIMKMFPIFCCPQTFVARAVCFTRPDARTLFPLLLLNYPHGGSLVPSSRREHKFFRDSQAHWGFVSHFPYRFVMNRFGGAKNGKTHNR